VSEGADGQRAVTEMLLDRLVDVRYAARPGQPSASVTGSRARATLAWIAKCMNEDGTRELAWWRISNWVSPWPYRFVVVLAVITWLLVSLMSFEVVALLIFAGPPALFSIVVLLLMRRRESGGIHLLPRLTWHSAMRPTAVAMASAALVGVLLMVCLWLGYGMFEGGLGLSDAVWVAGILLPFGVVFGVGAVPVGVAWVLSHAEGDPTPLTPSSAWQKSRRETQVVALLIALGVWLPFGLAWLLMGVLPGNGNGWLGLQIFGAMVLVGLEFAVMLGVIRSPTTRANVAAVQVALSHRTPLRLMRFLEDAHERGVLRTVGPVYEFRHAGLQDRLAGGQPDRSGSRKDPHLPGRRSTNDEMSRRPDAWGSAPPGYPPPFIGTGEHQIPPPRPSGLKQ
jgi:hypothetical protein